MQRREEISYDAKRYWVEAGVARKIDFRRAPALETWDLLIRAGQVGSYDLCLYSVNNLAYY